MEVAAKEVTAVTAAVLEAVPHKEATEKLGGGHPKGGLDPHCALTRLP